MHPSQELIEDGKAALRRGDWKKARPLLEKALEAGATAELYEELARACWWLNDIPAVIDYRTKAHHAFLAEEDPLGASRNASWLGIDYLELKGEFAVANGWFQRAENLLEGQPPSAELGLIKLLKGRLASIREPTSENAIRLLDESMALSTQFGQTETAMMAKALKGTLLVSEGKIPEGMSLLDEATLVATTAAPQDINFVTLACCMLIDACERVRDYERAGLWCEKVKEICRRWDFQAMFASCRNLYASVLVWKGKWKEAEDELLRAEEELQQLRPTYTSASIIRLADLRRRQGKWEETNDLLEKAGAHTLKLYNCAALAFEKEDMGTAANFAERYLRQLPPRDKTNRVAGLELLLRIYVQQEKPDDAAALLTELKEIAGIVDTPPMRAALRCAEGILHAAKGKDGLARQELEDAVDQYDVIGVPFESSRTRVALAEVLIRLGDFKMAGRVLQAAILLFDQLGALKDAERARQLQTQMHLTHAEAQALTKTCTFTGRELEVLRLIAEGKNNEETAAQLFLSVRTVEKHLSNIYLKLGISGKSARAFAASYAIRNKLVFQ